MANEIYALGRNHIYEWVVVAVDCDYWTAADGGTCMEDFYRQDLAPFIIGDRARVVSTDEDGIEETETCHQVLNRLKDQAVERANQVWGRDNWSRFEFLEPVWHKTQYNKFADLDATLGQNPYPVAEYRYGRDWEAEQQAEKNQQLDAWFVA